MKAAAPPDLASDQLFVNGRRQPLARYPNFDPQVAIYNGYAADAISPARVARWADPAGGFIHMMHGAMWGGYHYVITGKDAQGRLLYEGGWQNNRGGPIHRQYRMVENIFEESTRLASGSSTPGPTRSTSTRRQGWTWPGRPWRPCG